jgi:dihydropteroate synthase
MRGRLWKIGEQVVDLSRHGMIMGVLNVTPDSFSDGGSFFDRSAAVCRGIEMAAEGAQIIDVGGESTRPGAEPVLAAEELRRVIPVINGLHAQIDVVANCPHLSPLLEGEEDAKAPGKGQAFISIDTSKSEVAAQALDAGASIINDVTGGRGDPEMLSLAARKKAALIIMHMQGDPRTMQLAPRYDDVVSEVADFFLQQYGRALECGIDPMAIAFDPGIGFGKTLAHNIELLKNLEQLRVQDRPLVVGVSRKSFLAKLTGESEMKDRVEPTVALTAFLRGRGADIFRVHDVKENLAALRVTEAMLQ